MQQRPGLLGDGARVRAMLCFAVLPVFFLHLGTYLSRRLSCKIFSTTQFSS